jgi:two-component system response regulator RegA
VRGAQSAGRERRSEAVNRVISLLMVDDDREFRERLARALEVRGCRVTTASEPLAARQLWDAAEFDAAIVDLRLDTDSGLRLIPGLRQRRPEARIVVLTGFGSIGTAMEAGRLGVTEYFTKPVDVDRLHAVLRGRREGEPEGSPDASEVEVPSLDLVEWEHIQRVLSACDGNVSRTARLLGIDRRSLQRKLSKYPPAR